MCDICIKNSRILKNIPLLLFLVLFRHQYLFQQTAASAVLELHTETQTLPAPAITGSNSTRVTISAKM